MNFILSLSIIFAFISILFKKFDNKYIFVKINQNKDHDKHRRKIKCLSVEDQMNYGVRFAGAEKRAGAREGPGA